MGSRAVLDAVMKRKIPSPCQESNPRTPIVQSVAQRYTHWATASVNKPLFTFVSRCMNVTETSAFSFPVSVTAPSWRTAPE
jgi:hypothetical protein